MKWMIAIFSLYMLGLNLMPCGDDFCDEETVENHCDSETQDLEEDFCSPFCWCNCCSVSVVEFDGVQEPFPAISSNVKSDQVFYKNPFWDQFSGWILQPPQLVAV